MSLVDEQKDHVHVKTACDSLGVSRATYYRRRKPARVDVAKKPPVSHRRYSDKEREHILEVLCLEEFVDLSPHQVYAILLERGEYLCSVSTMYRVLRENRAVRERRRQRRHPPHPKPRLTAYQPNQVWTWDITKLPGPVAESFSTSTSCSTFTAA